MHSRIVDLYYFSGTGNTYLVAHTMAETLSEAGVETYLLPIDLQTPVRVAPGRALGLAFPVAYQSTYPFLWRYFQALPPGNGTEAFMVDTMGGLSGAIVGRMKGLMLRKGYRPIGACEIQMPFNFWLLDAEKMHHRDVIERGMEKARRYALDLVEGRARWGKLPVLADLAYGIYLLLPMDDLYPAKPEMVPHPQRGGALRLVRGVRQELPGGEHRHGGGCGRPGASGLWEPLRVLLKVRGPVPAGGELVRAERGAWVSGAGGHGLLGREGLRTPSRAPA